MEVKKYKMARSWLTDPDSGNSAGQWKNFVQQRKQEWKARQGFKGAGLVEQGPGGVRQGYGGPPVYTINEENFKLLDDLIPNTELTINEIKVKLGGKEKSGNQGVNKLIEAWETSDKDRVVSEKRFRPYKMMDTEFSQKIIDASKDPKYIKKDGTPNIKRIAKDFFPERKLDDARKAVRKILVSGIDYEGKKNIPGEITSAKQSKKNALENIKIAQKKAGFETTKQADQVIDKIVSQNEIYQKMSVEDIAKDKKLLNRLRVEIDPITGSVNYNGYTKLDVNKKTIMNDLELAQHAKNKAATYELFTHDHITPKAWRKQNVGYPNNFQSATYMENSQLDNARRYLMDNPDGNIQAIDNYLTSNNQTIRFGKNAKYKYGFKEVIKFNPETGTSNIVELSLKKTISKLKPVPYQPSLSFMGAAGFDDALRRIPGAKIGKFIRSWGIEFEPLFEAGFYEHARRKGLTHDEAVEETFFWKMFDPKSTTGLMEGAEPLLEKKLYEIRDEKEFIEVPNAKPIQNPDFGKLIDTRKGVKRYIDNEKALWDAYGKLDALEAQFSAQETYPGRVTEETLQSMMTQWDDYQLDANRLKNLIKPGTDDYQQYFTAKEKQDTELGVKGIAYGEYGRGDTERLAARRERVRKRAMKDKFPDYSKYEMDKMLEHQKLVLDPNIAAYKKDLKELKDIPYSFSEKYTTPATYESLEDYWKNYDKMAYFADNFRLEKAGGGMAGIRRPDAVPPKSGPDPQGEGLSYLFNRVKRW